MQVQIYLPLIIAAVAITAMAIYVSKIFKTKDSKEIDPKIDFPEETEDEI